jgi:hypothetical protein
MRWKGNQNIPEVCIQYTYKMGQTDATDEQIAKMQKAVDCSAAWAEIWGMTFNVAKGKSMHIGFNIPCHSFGISSQQLGVTDEAREIRVSDANTPTIRSVHKSGKSCFSLQGSTCFCATLCAVCTTTRRIWNVSLVPLDRWRQEMLGTSTGEGS